MAPALGTPETCHAPLGGLRQGFSGAAIEGVAPTRPPRAGERGARRGRLVPAQKGVALVSRPRVVAREAAAETHVRGRAGVRVVVCIQVGPHAGAAAMEATERPPVAAAPGVVVVVAPRGGRATPARTAVGAARAGPEGSGEEAAKKAVARVLRTAASCEPLSPRTRRQRRVAVAAPPATAVIGAIPKDATPVWRVTTLRVALARGVAEAKGGAMVIAAVDRAPAVV